MRTAGTNFLHVAPEACVSDRLRELVGTGYMSVDLLDPRAMEQMDICDIRHPDASFDAIYCNHVLEHVEDDRKALREFHRVLRNAGWAILMVPTYPGPTCEDPMITTAHGRLAAFGQEDHVRRYGEDFSERLVEAGFHVTVFGPRDLASESEIVRMGLTAAAGDLYFCAKDDWRP